MGTDPEGVFRDCKEGFSGKLGSEINGSDGIVVCSYGGVRVCAISINLTMDGKELCGF